MTTPADRRTEVDGASWLPTLSVSPAVAYPNRLSEPLPSRTSPPAAWGLLALLVAAAFLPRLVMAWLIPTICVDGTTYVALAEAVERGELNPATIYRFNLYPLILAGLHHLGLSWEAAGEAWGVAAGTLVVLPLFGWMRRQFDDRVAAVGCLLYAVHPELIEWSPELVRDQTFWLVFTTACYVLWRAATEVRLRFYLAAGLLLPTALFCRFEGVFLEIPLVLWTWTRWRALRCERRRLAGGLLLSAIVPITAGAVFACGLLKHEAVSKVVYTEPLRRAENMLRTLVAPESVLAETPLSDTEPFSLKLAWKFIRICERGLTPFYGLLLLAALLAYGRLWLRADHLPITLYCLCIAGGVWIHLWFTGEASSRYTLSIAIVSLRPMALCLMRLNARLLRATAASSAARPALRAAVCGIPPTVIAVFGLADAWSTSYDSRLAKAHLGKWILDECGEHCVVAGADEQLALVGYYARAVLHRLTSGGDAQRLLHEIDRSKPAFVIVSRPELTDAENRALLEGKQRLGLEEVHVSAWPPSESDTLFLVRPTKKR